MNRGIGFFSTRVLGTRTIETYERVTRTGHKSVRCPNCGKRVRRQRTFGQTLNPFNTKDGRLKTRAEIDTELLASVIEWKKQAEQCTPCKEQ